MDPITQQILDQQRAIQLRLGFEGYQPSFSSLDEGIAALQTPTANQSLDMSPMGIQEDQLMNQTGIGALGFQPTDVIDPMQMAKNIAINRAIDYGVQKLGLPKTVGTILGTTINPALSAGIIPLQGIAAIGSNLFGRAGNIATALQAKRAQKAITREATRDLQQRMDKGEFGSVTPTGQDERRGGQYSGATTSSSKSSTSRSARHTAGPGGLHSDY